jgi:hypothetical protein
MSSKTFRLKSDSSDYCPTNIVLPRGYTVSTSRATFQNAGTVDIQDVVEWPHPEAKFYLKSLGDNYNLRNWVVPQGKDNTLYRHICRLKECLVWWEESPTKNKIGTAYGIMHSNLTSGPSFADELSDCLDYSIRLSASCGLVYGKDDFPPQATEITSVEQIFHPHHLIPFRRPDKNDIDYLFAEPSAIKGDLIEEFKDEVRNCINRPFEAKRELDDFDRISLMGSQSAFDPEKNSRETKTALRLKQPEMRMTDYWIYDSVLVDKQPNESRDSVVGSIETTATLYLLRLQLRQVLKVEGDVIWEKAFGWLPEWASSYSKNLFLMSDQKKCGLTFSRQLLIALFSVLEEEFPSWDFGFAVRGLQNTWVKDRRTGVLRKALGGPGLGQLSEAISACMAILFKIWKNKQDPELHLEGKFFNDDQVIRFRCDCARVDPLPPEIIELATSWDQHMESYGLLVHRKKPFLCEAGLLLEIYGKGFPVSTEKTCQWVGNFFKALCQPNIVAAKEYVSGLLDNIFPEERQLGVNILQRVIIPYWGYEFCPQEVSYPYQFGGWYRFRSEEGLDMAFHEVSNLPPSWESLRNLISVKHKAPQGGRKKDLKFKALITSTGKTLTREKLELPDAWNYHAMGLSAVGAFRPSSKVFLKSYKDFAERRAQAFCKRPMPIRDFFNFYWEASIEEGKGYAPPLSVYQEGSCCLPFGDNLDTGEASIKDDPKRAFFKLLQEDEKLSKLYTFYSKRPVHGLNHALYCFLRDLDMGPFRRTLHSIILVMLVGVPTLEKYLQFGLREYGKIILPFPKTKLADTFIGLLGNGLDDYIYLNHTGEFCANTNLPVELEFDLTRIEYAVEKQILSAINASFPEDKVLTVSSLSGVEQLLVPEDEAVKRQQVNLPAAVGLTPSVEEEERLLLAYLIHQVTAPDHLHAVEETIRSGLAGQVLPGMTDQEDIFDNEDESYLDMFG